MLAHEFVSSSYVDKVDPFKAHSPNAVLTWVDGGETKEAELLILSAKPVGHGMQIAYKVKLRSWFGEMPEGKIGPTSLFADNGCVSRELGVSAGQVKRFGYYMALALCAD